MKDKLANRSRFTDFFFVGGVQNVQSEHSGKDNQAKMNDGNKIDESGLADNETEDLTRDESPERDEENDDRDLEQQVVKLAHVVNITS